MTIQPVHFSSIRSDWGTPQAVFDVVNHEFKFTLDVCATAENAKCPRFYAEQDDGLAQSWKGETCWTNPPYGRQMGKWIKKAYEESQQGADDRRPLPCRTDTVWFHDYCLKGEIRVFRGRLYFDDGGEHAPFPSCIVVFRYDHPTVP